jgi:hypothetical protein
MLNETAVPATAEPPTYVMMILGGLPSRSANGFLVSRNPVTVDVSLAPPVLEAWIV